MRQIKASEVRPGMTIRWTNGDVSHQCPLAGVERFNNDQDVQGNTPQGQVVLLHRDDDVLVVKEPPQPEEPTAFGARVVVGGLCFVRRGAAHLRPWENEAATVFNWREVKRLGEVTVIDADPYWTAPEDAPETPVVPERIEDWPEDDAHLRAYKWKDSWGYVWSCWEGAWGYQSSGSAWRKPVVIPRPFDGPWTRVTGA